MSPRWRKVLADLRDNKIRTLLVVLSIAVGVFAVGGIAGAFSIIGADMESDYRSVNPHSATIRTSPFDDEVVVPMRHVPGVTYAEGRSSLGARVRLPNNSVLTVAITAIPGDGQMNIDRIRRADGGQGLDLGRHEAFLDISALSKLNLKPGDNLTLEMPDNSTRTMRVAGLVQDVTMVGPAVGGPVTVFVSPDTIEWLGGSALYNRLLLVVSENAADLQHVKAVADIAADKLGNAGVTVNVIEVSRPGDHPARSTTDALLSIMTILCVLTVGLSAFLVVNTITALLGQQLRQIGVLKAIGARSWQVLGIYLALVACFGLLALLISLPLAAAFSWGVAGFVSNMTNFNLSGFRIPPLAIGLEVLVAIVMPLAAALLPVWSGTRVTVREAIASYGLGQGETGRDLIDRALNLVRGLPRPWLLSLRNTFRRKGRLFLTLSALTLGGAIFMSVIDLQTTFGATISETFSYTYSDVNVDLRRTYRVDQIQSLFERVPGISYVEARTIMNAQALPLDPASPSIDVQLRGSPSGSTLIDPVMTAGRWLLPEDENAIVIGNHMAARRPDLKVGDTLTIRIRDRDTTWHIVGIYLMAGNQGSPMLFVNREPLDRLAGLVGQSSTFLVQTTGKSGAEQKAVAQAIEQVLNSQGIEVSNIATGAENEASQMALIGILLSFMLVMAVLIAVVGGLGLMGTMSMNVLERTREIGVLRAIGASNGSIMGMILLEGLLIGGLSWALASVLSFPIGAALSAGAGKAFVQVPMSLVVSWNGFIVWLLIALSLSAVASLLPAWNASRLTIREVLAYE